MATDNSVRYESISIHFDRLNIVKRFERNSNLRNSEIKPALNLKSLQKNNSQLQLAFENESKIIYREDFNKLNNNQNIIAEIPKRIIRYNTDNKLSLATRNKLSKSIRYLNYISTEQKVLRHNTSKEIKFKIAFLTLTLSSAQVHSDNEIKNKLLNQLFIEFKKKYRISNYVWRCEKQLNGNAHFHILVDKFIPHAELRDIWNRLQNKLGYIDRYAAKMSNLTYTEYENLYQARPNYSRASIRKAYAKGKSTSWLYPNSTDVHSLQFINDIDSYLIKYMSKDEQNKDIEGRLWGCSQSLSNIKGAMTIVDTNISAELTKLYSTGKAKFFTGNYYTIAFVDIMFLKYIGCNLLFELYREFLINHFKLESS